MEPMSQRLKIFNLITAVLVIASLALVFFYAPMERVTGNVQRVFYWHVPAAWTSFLAFFVTVVAGIIYLLRGNRKWDRVAHASVEIGLLFTIMTMVSGSIWARPTWQTWWTWDPRLTTYTIMALIYVAYLMLRQGIEDPDRRARFAAVYGIIGFVSVPITYFSIHWWRTLHPVVIGSGSPTAEGGFDMTRPMVWVLLFSLFTVNVVYFCFLANRLRLARMTEYVEELKAQLLPA
jgi:heme exporter protein C